MELTNHPDFAPYRTPLGGFDTWEAAALACERADLDPCTCIEIVVSARPAAVTPESAQVVTPAAPITVLRVGSLQVAGLEIYVLDPIFDEPLDEDDQQPFPGFLLGQQLHILDPVAAWRCVTDAANSADSDGDRQLRDALTVLARRVLALTSRRKVDL